MMRGVFLCRMLGVFDCVQLMAMGEMSVVARFLVIARLRKTGRLPMVLRSVLVMLGRFVVMMMNFVFGHWRFS
jgi:hypothetical protein